MVERLATRFRALLGGRGEPAPANDDLDDDRADDLPASDPEWDELLVWARESEAEPASMRMPEPMPMPASESTSEDEDEGDWAEVIVRAKQAALARAADEAEEWGRLLELAKARPAPAAPAPVIAHPAPPAPAPVIAHRAPAGLIASLTARLERLAAQVPDDRRRRAR